MNTVWGLLLTDKSEDGEIYGTYVCRKLFNTEDEAHEYAPEFCKRTCEEYAQDIIGETLFNIEAVELELPVK